MLEVSEAQDGYQTTLKLCYREQKNVQSNKKCLNRINKQMQYTEHFFNYIHWDLRTIKIEERLNVETIAVLMSQSSKSKDDKLDIKKHILYFSSNTITSVKQKM